MVKSKTKLAIFDTFKTKGDDLTGEANRQRAIISILGSSANPAEKTRTGISQRIAKKQGIAWKNIYSGIFYLSIHEFVVSTCTPDSLVPKKKPPKTIMQLKNSPNHL